MNIIYVRDTFNTQEKCLDFLEKLHWPDDQIICPHCHSDKTYRLKTNKYKHHCNGCNGYFNVLKNSIFEGTKKGLPIWFLAMALIMNAKKGISSLQLSRHLGVAYNTAWRMQMIIRCAMEPENQGQLFEWLDKNHISLLAKKVRNGISILTGRKSELHMMYATEYKNQRHLMYAQALNFHIDQEYKRRFKQEQFPCRILQRYIPKPAIGQHPTFKFNYDTKWVFGMWHQFKRSVFGQYHHISFRYTQQYLNEISFKQLNHNTMDDLFAAIWVKQTT